MDQRDQERITAAYTRLFSTDDGVTVLKDLMKAHYVQESLPRNEQDFAEGQRNVVLRILAICEKDLTIGV